MFLQNHLRPVYVSNETVGPQPVHISSQSSFCLTGWGRVWPCSSCSSTFPSSNARALHRRQVTFKVRRKLLFKNFISPSWRAFHICAGFCLCKLVCGQCSHNYHQAIIHFHFCAGALSLSPLSRSTFTFTSVQEHFHFHFCGAAISLSPLSRSTFTFASVQEHQKHLICTPCSRAFPTLQKLHRHQRAHARFLFIN